MSLYFDRAEDNFGGLACERRVDVRNQVRHTAVEDRVDDHDTQQQDARSQSDPVDGHGASVVAEEFSKFGHATPQFHATQF